MPQVIVRFNQQLPHAPMDHPRWEDLERQIAEIVATALNVEGSESFQLHPDDVEVFIEPIFERRSYFERNAAPITIVVTANKCPERVANLTERNDQIIDGVLEYSWALAEVLLQPDKPPTGKSRKLLGVWTQLVDGAYTTR